MKLRESGELVAGVADPCDMSVMALMAVPETLSKQCLNTVANCDLSSRDSTHPCCQ